MPDFNDLVKNLYTSKNRELTQDKLDYINKTYNGKETDFVKNFYATIGEELTQDKLNYISDTYLKKKEPSLLQSSAIESPLQRGEKALSGEVLKGMESIPQVFNQPKESKENLELVQPEKKSLLSSIKPEKNELEETLAFANKILKEPESLPVNEKPSSKYLYNVNVITNLPKGEVKSYELDLKTKDAILNTVKAKYANKGLKFDVNSPSVKKEINNLSEKEKNDELSVVTGKDNKNYLVRSEGFIKSFFKTLANSFYSTYDAYKINSITNPKELAVELNYRSSQEPNIPESAPSKFLGNLGAIFGGVPKMGAEMAIPYIGESLMVGDAYYNALANEKQRLYWKGINEGLDEVSAAEKAMQTAGITAVPEAAMAYAMGRGLGNLKPKADIPLPVQESFRKSLKSAVKSNAIISTSGGGLSGLKSGIEALSGYNVSLADGMNSIIDGMEEYALMDAAFKGMHLFPKAVKSAAKNLLSNVPKPILEAKAAEMEEGSKILIEVNNFEKTKDKIKDIVSEDKIPSVAGLTEKQDNLKNEISDLENRKKEIPTALHNEIDLQIQEKQQEVNSIDNQINKIINSKEPLKEEIDDVTGIKMGENIMKPSEEISSEKEINENKSKSFIEAGKLSKKEQSPKALGDFIIDNAEVGDIIRINEDEYYEVVRREKYKKGDTEIELQHFVKNQETGEFENNPSGIKLFNDKYRGTELEKLGYKDASNLFETSYTNSKGEKIIEQAIYEPKQEIVEPNKALSSVEETTKALNNDKSIIDKIVSKIKDTFYTGRNKKYEDLKTTKGDFIFFSKNKENALWYGGKEESLTPAFIDNSDYLDLTNKNKKSEFVDKYVTDEDIKKLYPELSREAFDDRNVRKTFEEKLKEKIDKKRENLKENRFSGDNKEQKFLLNKAKELGFKGINLLDTFFGKEDISTIVIDKNTIKTLNPENISELYHKAKADGSNPELVKAVEELLGKPTEEIKTTEEVTPKETKVEVTEDELNNRKKVIDEIKSKNLTHVEGTGMGAKQADGMYLSTEKGNRYETEGKPAKKVDVEIENPKVTDYVENKKLQKEKTKELIDKEQLSLEDIETQYWNEISKFSNKKLSDITPKDVTNWFNSIKDIFEKQTYEEYLKQSAEEKIAKSITEKYKSEGYDALYIPETENTEGELIVFDRSKVKEKGEVEPIAKSITEKYKSEGYDALSIEPPEVEGQKITTISGKTEQERLDSIEKRKKETTVTEKVKAENDLWQDAQSLFNKNKNYFKSSEGLQELNRLRAKARGLGFEVDLSRNAIVKKGKNGRLIKLKYNNKADSGAAINENSIVILDRPKEVQDTFNEFNELGVFLDVKRPDGVRFTPEQVELAIQDIIDGIPSNRANDYLDLLEKSINENSYPIYDKGIGEANVRIEELRDALVGKEQVGQPMDEENLISFLNDEAKLTYELEEQLLDNIENLLIEYETEPSTELPTETRPETKISKIESKTEEGVSTKTQPITEATKIEPTPIEMAYEEALNKKGEKSKENAKKEIIESNFDSIVSQLMLDNKIKRICE